MKQSDIIIDYLKCEDARMSTPSQATSINWQMCVELANQNTEMASDLLKMFVADLPEVSKAIQEYFNLQDFTRLQAQVHKLHGASCYCGVPHLKNAAKQLETALKSIDNKSISNNELEDFVSILLDEINAVEIAYTQNQFN